MKGSFLTNPAIKDDIITAVKDVKCKGWVFTIDEENEAHVKFAVVRRGEVLGYDKDWEGEKKKATDATKFAVSRADGETEKLRWELVEDGHIDPEWEATQAFERGRWRRTLRKWIGKGGGVDAAGACIQNR